MNHTPTALFVVSLDCQVYVTFETRKCCVYFFAFAESTLILSNNLMILQRKKEVWLVVKIWCIAFCHLHLPQVPWVGVSLAAFSLATPSRSSLSQRVLKLSKNLGGCAEFKKTFLAVLHTHNANCSLQRMNRITEGTLHVQTRNVEKCPRLGRGKDNETSLQVQQHFTVSPAAVDRRICLAAGRPAAAGRCE